MKDIFNLNLVSIFYPNQSIQYRLINKNHLRESILLSWIAYLFYISYEITLVNLDLISIRNDFSSLFFLLLLGILFPIIIFIEVFYNFFIMRSLLPERIRDEEIDAIIGNSLSSNLFYIIPLIGPGISFVASKLILFINLKHRVSLAEVFVVLVSPIILSIFIIAFFLFCLALFFVNLSLFLV